MPKRLTHSEKVVKAVGKRPITATQVAEKLKLPSHRNVARALGDAVSQGKLVKTETGKYQSALNQK
jgi:hypothetical protein